MMVKPNDALTGEETPRWGRYVPGSLALAAGGVLARLLLIILSVGTNDFLLYRQFAMYYLEEGLAGLFRDQPDFNHTPLTTVYFVTAWVVAGGSDHLFSIFLKLPVVGADVGTMWLLWKIWNGRGGRGVAALAVAVFGWNLCSILITGYHCNTDPIYGFLMLLAAWLLAEKGNAFAAGLALAGAINVKLVPVLLIVPLALQCRSWKHLAHFIGALAVGAVPFLALLAQFGSVFVQKVVGYTSNVERWGVMLVLLELRNLLPGMTEGINAVGEFYHRFGGYLVLAGIVGLSVGARRRGWGVYETCARALALFLVFTPGWGVQYAVIIVPLLAAVSVRWSVVYGGVAGVYLAALYVHFYTGSFPWVSVFDRLHPLPQALVGLLPWGIWVAYLVTPARRTVWLERIAG